MQVLFPYPSHCQQLLTFRFTHSWRANREYLMRATANWLFLPPKTTFFTFSPPIFASPHFYSFPTTTTTTTTAVLFSSLFHLHTNDPKLTLHRLYMDPTWTPYRPYIDLTSIPHRPYDCRLTEFLACVWPF